MTALDVDPNVARPGWVALLIVLALIGATVFLWRNMGKQIKKIDFDEVSGLPPRKDPDDPDDPDEPAVPGDRSTSKTPAEPDRDADSGSGGAPDSRS